MAPNRTNPNLDQIREAQNDMTTPKLEAARGFVG